MEIAGSAGMYFCVIRGWSGSLFAEFAGVVTWCSFNCAVDYGIAFRKRHVHTGVRNILCSQHLIFKYLG